MPLYWNIWSKFYILTFAYIYLVYCSNFIPINNSKIKNNIIKHDWLSAFIEWYFVRSFKTLRSVGSFLSNFLFDKFGRRKSMSGDIAEVDLRVENLIVLERHSERPYWICNMFGWLGASKKGWPMSTLCPPAISPIRHPLFRGRQETAKKPSRPATACHRRHRYHRRQGAEQMYPSFRLDLNTLHSLTCRIGVGRWLFVDFHLFPATTSTTNKIFQDFYLQIYFK